MGRELVFEVRAKNKAIWPTDENFKVVSRDDSTAVIVSRIAREVLAKDPNAEHVLTLTCNDYRKYLDIKEELTEKLQEDKKKIQDAKEMIEDMREARRHASFEDFFNFTNEMMRKEYWIEQNQYSVAETLIKYLNLCYDKMLDLVNDDPSPDRKAVIDKYTVAVVWSE